MVKISLNTQRLKAALLAEKGNVRMCIQRYKSLPAKVIEDQVGCRPNPTEEKFTQLLEYVKHAVSLKKMLVGG